MPKCNGAIRASQVRVVKDNGEMLGVLSLHNALKIAEEEGLDLVEISPHSNPPVCKLMDFGKYKYGLQKKAQAAKKNQKVVNTKEIKIRPTIAEGDYQVKLKNAVKFLNEGDKIKVSLQFKGREVTHDEIGFNIIERFKKNLIEYGKVELEPKKEGKYIIMIMAPK